MAKLEFTATSTLQYTGKEGGARAVRRGARAGPRGPRQHGEVFTARPLQAFGVCSGGHDLLVHAESHGAAHARLGVRPHFILLPPVEQVGVDRDKLCRRRAGAVCSLQPLRRRGRGPFLVRRLHAVVDGRVDRPRCDAPRRLQSGAAHLSQRTAHALHEPRADVRARGLQVAPGAEVPCRAARVVVCDVLAPL